MNAHFRIRSSGSEGFVIGSGITMILIGIAAFVAWCTHVVWIIGKLAGDQGATVGQMVLGALGAFMPPVGVVHGVMIWFGVGF